MFLVWICNLNDLQPTTSPQKQPGAQPAFGRPPRQLPAPLFQLQPHLVNGRHNTYVPLINASSSTQRSKPIHSQISFSG